MFYDTFEILCRNKGVSPNRACLEMGLSRSIAAKWKNTNTKPSADVLPIIAEYFGVSTDYLLGAEIEKAPTPEGERSVNDDDIKFALFGTREIDDDVLEQVKSFAKFARENRKDK